MRRLAWALLLLLIACGAPTRAPVEPTPAEVPPTEPIETTRAPEPTIAPEPTELPTPEPTRDPNIDPTGAPPLDKDNCPETYPVKGNIRNDGGKLYHLKGGPGYAATDPERCFATAADALAAGFTSAQ